MDLDKRVITHTESLYHARVCGGVTIIYGRWNYMLRINNVSNNGVLLAIRMNRIDLEMFSCLI